MIKTIENIKEKKNRIAVISGEGNLPNQIIKELILNNIDPIAFFPKNFNLSLPLSSPNSINTHSPIIFLPALYSISET